MCELYAINSARPVEANQYLRVFYRDSVEHPHGWGLSWREQERVVLHKEPVRAIDSSYLQQVLAEPIVVNRLVAHIRKASVGSLAYHNSHPFLCDDVSGRKWVIAHNGTMLDSRLIDDCKPLAQGATDSEQVAIYLTQRMSEEIRRKGSALTFDERFLLLEREMERLSAGNKLNLLMDDGEYTYLHTNTVQPTLYLHQVGDTVFFCTRPQDDGVWEELPGNRIVAYRDGRLMGVGERHSHSIDEEAYLRDIAGMCPV